MPKTKVILSAISVCLAVAFCYLLTGYIRQDTLQKRLDTQITQSRQTLASLPVPDSGLSQLYEESHQTNQDVKQSLAARTDSTTDVIDRLLQNAEALEVQIEPIIGGDYEEKTVGKSEYRFQPIELTITGSLDDILAFLQVVENPDLYPNVVVNHLSLNQTQLPDNTQETRITGSLALSVVSGSSDSP